MNIKDGKKILIIGNAFNWNYGTALLVIGAVETFQNLPRFFWESYGGTYEFAYLIFLSIIRKKVNEKSKNSYTFK